MRTSSTGQMINRTQDAAHQTTSLKVRCGCGATLDRERQIHKHHGHLQEVGRDKANNCHLQGF